jgi:predicted helicase
MSKLEETDTNPSILYNYAKPPLQGDVYNPAINVDVDKTEEQEEELLAKLSELVDVAENEEEDLESADELPKDNEFSKISPEDNGDLVDKLNKEAERVASEMDKKSKKLESVLDQVCSGSKSLSESFEELGL